MLFALGFSICLNIILLPLFWLSFAVLNDKLKIIDKLQKGLGEKH